MNTVFTLRCLPRRRCVLSTTRGSLTCIGRYISGAKSMLATRRWKGAKSAAQHQRGEMVVRPSGGVDGFPQALFRLVPNENSHGAISGRRVPGSQAAMSESAFTIIRSDLVFFKQRIKEKHTQANSRA